MKQSMKKLLEDWNTLQQYKDIKKIIHENRINEIIVIDEVTIENHIKYLKKFGLNDATLMKNCDSVIDFFSSDEDKSDMELFTMGLTSKMTREDMIDDFLKTIVTWFCYLRMSLSTENYELANKIKKCLEIEQFEILNIFARCYPLTIEIDRKEIEELFNHYQSTFIK